MITDRIQLAGINSYFKKPDGTINLGGTNPSPVRTLPMKKGKQLEISGIQLLIEHQDLQQLLQHQFDTQGISQPLLKVSVMKEMFAGLFADPFSHRVHNVAGFLDFNEGTITNGKVMEIEGVPTIVSTGKAECMWVSRVYTMPDPISIDAIAWELAISKLTPPDSFSYMIQIDYSDSNGTSSFNTGNNFIKADVPRFIDLQGQNIIQGVTSFQITFRALVKQDSFFQERHLPIFNENIGRPLLRAVNILEPVKSIHEYNSLNELISNCSDYKLFEVNKLLQLAGPSLNRFIGTLALNATLVSSENQTAQQYEFIEWAVFNDQLIRLEAKMVGEELIRVS